MLQSLKAQKSFHIIITLMHALIHIFHGSNLHYYYLIRSEQLCVACKAARPIDDECSARENDQGLTGEVQGEYKDQEG